MKQFYTTLGAILLIIIFIQQGHAQWQSNGNNTYNTNSGNIGIGPGLLFTPLAKLHVSDGSLLLSGTNGNTPISGSGTRMMWIPAKESFRAGFVSGSHWNDQSIGQGSFAMGADVIASGYGSFTFGNTSTTSGSGAISLGVALQNSGDNAILIGSGTCMPANICPLNNTISNSLSVGFNSDVPTFFIGTSNGEGTTGNVGIATTSPLQKLEVNGAVKIGNTVTANAGAIRWTGTDFEGYNGTTWKSFTQLGTNYWNLSGNNISYPNGNVGIATDNPQEKLEVNGAVKLGNTTTTNAGTLQWTGTDFQGYDGKAWKSLTGLGNGQWKESGSNIYYSIGKVGIGAADPQNTLHLHSEEVPSPAPVKLPPKPPVYIPKHTPFKVTTLDNSSCYLQLTNKETGKSKTDGLKIGVNGTDAIISINEKATLSLLNYGDNGKQTAIRLKSDNSINFSTNLETRMVINTDGNVGIGTQYPTAKLQVENEAATIAKIVAKGNYDSKLWMMNNKGSYAFGIDKDGKGNIYENITTSTPIMTFLNGSVGIGTINPSAGYKLSVSGIIRAQKIIVETGWSDFVFDKEYPLMSLDDVKAYIEKNKHLPDLPSEKEIEQNGADLGTLLSKQMQKIEELTLYVLQLKQENENIKKQLLELANKH